MAAYKASRFAEGRAAADLCAGIGGDLLALAVRGPALAVERDPVAAFLAEANLHLAGLQGTVRVADAAECSLAEFAAWHVDPDRRPAGRRTTRIELHEPELSTLEQWLQVQESAAIKLSPAAEAPAAWQRRAELEWVSRAGQCRQLVAWFGTLARDPGRRRATIVGGTAGGHTVLASWMGNASVGPPIAARVGRYLFDPDPAILASGLLGTVAVEERLAALAPWGGYLTGPEPLRRPGLAALEVDEVLPFDVKRLRRLLAERGVGRLEIKKRAVECDPDVLRKKLQLRGDREAVLVVAPLGQSVAAILGHRLSAAEACDCEPTLPAGPAAAYNWGITIGGTCERTGIAHVRADQHDWIGRRHVQHAGTGDLASERGAIPRDDPRLAFSPRMTRWSFSTAGW